MSAKMETKAPQTATRKRKQVNSNWASMKSVVAKPSAKKG